MRRKPVTVFLLHAAFLLALLGVVPGTNEIVPRVFQAAGNGVLQSMGSGRSVRFEWADPQSRPDSADTRMLGREFGHLKYRWRVVYNSHRRIFWPAATLVALILATPMSRRRLALALPIGLLVFQALFMLQAAAFAVVLFGAVGSLAVGSPAAWQRVFPVARAMFNTPITNFAVTFFLWAWLASPARGIDTQSSNALLQRLLGTGAGSGSQRAANAPPGADTPPAAGAANASEGAPPADEATS
jgi:hypothetical protein